MSDKKLLIVGGSAVWAIETHYTKHLNALGLETKIFNCSSYYNSGSLFNKVKFRLDIRSLFNRVNQALLQECERWKPDIVWIFKGAEIFPRTLEKLRTLGILLVNYNPDHPFIRTFASNGGRNVPNSVPYYDLHFSYRRDLVEQFQQQYGLKSAWLPFGFELSADQSAIVKQEPEVIRACFIGTPDRARVKTLVRLATQGIPIDIYGQGYQQKYKLTKHKNIRTFDVVLETEFWKKICSYRVQLNFFRPHNIGSHNLRSFEVPGAGGILLAPDSPDHRYFFESEKEIFLYQNEDEMIEKIELLLHKPSEEVAIIRQAARQKSLEAGYGYEQRAASVFKTFRNLHWV